MLRTRHTTSTTYIIIIVVVVAVIIVAVVIVSDELWAAFNGQITRNVDGFPETYTRINHTFYCESWRKLRAITIVVVVVVEKKKHHNIIYTAAVRETKTWRTAAAVLFLCSDSGDNARAVFANVRGA